MKKTISNIFTVFVIAIAVILLTVGIVPRVMGYSGYYVTSDSMYPSIKKGSLLLVKDVKFEDIKKDDVLTFTKEGSEKWFSHRVVEVNTYDKSFKTKGDNNNIADPGYTPYTAVVGKVYHQIPLVGYISMALATTWGKVALLAVCVFYAAIEVENVASKKRKKKEGLSE